ncbi:hypothetical protein V2G26_001474 [Clonostachys chloroleuca]
MLALPFTQIDSFRRSVKLQAGRLDPGRRAWRGIEQAESERRIKIKIRTTICKLLSRTLPWGCYLSGIGSRARSSPPVPIPAR